VSRLSCLLAVAVCLAPRLGIAAPPAAADKRLVVELVAGEPDLVTPTGVAVDERGRIWVIENHTHQRPANYKGPTSDRILIFDDFGPDGKARQRSVFADGFKDTMGIALGKKGAVYVATRSTIYLLRDTKGNGKADEKTVLVHLDTKADYPHNGLSGFAIDMLGDVYFGLGENFGAPYKLIGSDKTTLTGGGEGGSIYRMRPDGSKLERIATGFWNPFHMAFDRWGRLFAVDNDPDARGPCRLLHIVPGGDYGYRFKYGRKGIHPFQSWNGELPGTLPMVAGTAEAPSGILAYESDGLPEEYRGLLFVTSWGDHVIEQFQLEPRGASFGAKKKMWVRGGEDFRPVGIAQAPDGSVVVSDWVDKSYPVHGKGRLWRIRWKDRPAGNEVSPATLHKEKTAKLKILLHHPRRDVRLAAALELATREKKAGELLVPVLKNDPDPLARLHALWSLSATQSQAAPDAVVLALFDKAAEVRAVAVHLCVRHNRELPRELDGPDYWLNRLGQLAIADPAPVVRLAALPVAGDIYKELRDEKLYDQLLLHLGDPDPFLFQATVAALLTPKKTLPVPYVPSKVKYRLGVLLVHRGHNRLDDLPQFLDDPDPEVRRTAIQWVAEEQLTKYAKLIDQAATKQPLSREVFEAWLAAQELFANPKGPKDPTKEISGDVFVLKVFKDAKQPATFRALALRMLPPHHAAVKTPELLVLLKDADKTLRGEAIKTLAWRQDDAAQKALRELADDTKADAGERSDAVLGLAHSAPQDGETRRLLLHLVEGRRELLRDALRSLRGALAPKDAKSLDDWWKQVTRDAFFSAADCDDLAEHALLALGQPFTGNPKVTSIQLTVPRPATVTAWRDFLLPGKGDAAAGERVFFHSKGPRCFACHRIDGRGEAVGPDLSHIGSAMKRVKLIESILEPSKEIAPAFVSWLITTRDGKQHTGVIVEEGANSTLTLADTQGRLTVLKITDIEERVAQPTSIMPAELHAQMTRQEFLDLLAFLEARR
jgi:putative membrane-bound dehydrogenase-like protein